MFTATVLAIFLVPFFFVLISGGLRDKPATQPEAPEAPESGA
jgi:hypothetical protein